MVSFAEAFKQKDLPLHVLVENAGVFLVPHDRTKEDFEVTVGTNYFGMILQIFFKIFHKGFQSSKQVPSYFQC